MQGDEFRMESFDADLGSEGNTAVQLTEASITLDEVGYIATITFS